MKAQQIRCIICGQFIAYSDIPNKVKINHIPDSPFTTEETEYTHTKCIKP